MTDNESGTERDSMGIEHLSLNPSLGGGGADKPTESTKGRKSLVYLFRIC